MFKAFEGVWGLLRVFRGYKVVLGGFGKISGVFKGVWGFKKKKKKFKDFCFLGVWSVWGGGGGELKGFQRNLAVLRSLLRNLGGLWGGF